MKKRKQQEAGLNYLEFVPVRSSLLTWNADAKGIITLDVENTGFFNRLAQKLFHRPEVTHIHLDKLGSFIWPRIDGIKNIVELGAEVEAEFGEDASPLYERLSKYFQILESYHFIQLKKDLGQEQK